MNKYIWLGFGTLIILVIVSLIYIVSPYHDEVNSKEEIVEICSNLSLTKTADCLNKQISIIFFYNDTDDYIIVKKIGNVSILEENVKSFYELKRYGGDCKDWAKLYEELGKSLNYSSTYVEIKDKTNGHAFTILYKEGRGYCILDMLRVECF